MTTTYQQERVGDWIQTYTGGKFYVLDPRKEDVNIENIAHALSNLARFTGHSNRFYCVGEHSIYCARIGRMLGWTPLQQLYLLLHDSTEHIVNDVARPLKQYLYDYKEIEDKIMSVIWDSFGLPQPTEEDYRLVKLVDNTMLINEITQLMKRTDFEVWNIESIDMSVNLKRGYNAGESKYDFLVMFNDLMNEYKGL